MAIIVRVTGFDAAERKLQQLALFMSDLRPFWPRVIPLFIGWMREQFSTEGEWGGDPWAQLSPTYAAVKDSVYGGKGILQATGDLRQSASRPERRATPTTLTLEFDGSGSHHGPIAAYHQKGTSKMPARPLVPDVLPLAGYRELEAAAAAYVSEITRSLELA